MRFRALFALCLSLVASAAVAQTTTWPNQQEGDYVIKDFRFASGETLPELRMHYRTLGTAKRNAAGEIVNGVLLLHGTSGSGNSWFLSSLADELFAKGQPLDTAEHFIIIPDSIGVGRSSKPSDGLRDQVSALSLQRHRARRASIGDRASQGAPSASCARQLDGRHADLDVGLYVSRPDGRVGADREPAHPDQRPQLDAEARAHRGDQERSRIQRRQLHEESIDLCLHAADGGDEHGKRGAAPGDGADARSRRCDVFPPRRGGEEGRRQQHGLRH